MGLSSQIDLIIFSFFYGMLFGFSISMSSKLLHHKNHWIRYLFTIGFVLLHILIYFSVLKNFFYGILHPYSLLLLTLGLFAEHAIAAHVEIRIKK